MDCSIHAVSASAALDRLLHRATVISVRGESYRLRERRKAIGAEAMPGPERASEQATARAGARSRSSGREEGGERTS